jgi:hypothetical protein
VIAAGRTMKAEEYIERVVELDSWQVKLTSYKLGDVYHCTADNVSPGAWLARTTGTTRAEAEAKALERARKLLSRTHRNEV